jgi:hypothetical protein
MYQQNVGHALSTLIELSPSKVIERKHIMAEPRKKSSRKGSEEMTLVRGSDGKLYLVSTTKGPVKVKPETAKEVNHLLDCIEDKLEDAEYQTCGIQNHIHAGVPTIFVRHQR